jgi:tellurite resistance protein TerC
MDSAGAVGIFSIIVQLIFLEGILSIDNAAVLGAMVSVLPDDKPVPYPRFLHFLQHFTDRVLGMQQMAALKVGLLGAYMGRALMLVAASWVIHNPTLQIIGALYLVKLAFNHLSAPETPEEAIDMEHRAQHQRAFWLVVLNVELADLAFSLDNVVAAVALSDKLWVVMIGVALGILTMRFAAGLFTWMIKREPILETAAYIVVFNIGAELLLGEFAGLHFGAWEKFLISAGTLILCVVYAHVRALRVLAPMFHWIAEGMGNVNELIDWALKPFVLLVKLIARGLVLIGRALLPFRQKTEPGV